MPSETIKLTAKFKLKTVLAELDGLFQTYREIMNSSLPMPTSLREQHYKLSQAKKETYEKLREEYRPAEPPLLHSLPDIHDL